MKKWEQPVLTEISIKDTEDNFLGWYYDGGYIGDGEVGLLTFDESEKQPLPTCKPSTPTQTPSTPNLDLRS